MTFSRRYFQFLILELVEDNWRKLVVFSSVKDVDLIQSNLKVDSILGTKHIESIMLYALTKSGTRVAK